MIMIIVLLIKFIYLLRIQINKMSVSYQKRRKINSIGNLKKVFLNIQIICKMPIKILQNTRQARNAMY